MTDMAAAAGGNAAPDAERGDLELEEGWRAAAAAGFDNDMTLDGDRVRCAACGQSSLLRDVTFAGAVFVRDTPSAREDLAVHELHCPRCGRASRLTAAATLMADL